MLNVLKKWLRSFQIAGQVPYPYIYIFTVQKPLASFSPESLPINTLYFVPQLHVLKRNLQQESSLKKKKRQSRRYLIKHWVTKKTVSIWTVLEQIHERSTLRS